MTVAQIKNMVMFQTNNDVDDLGDFLPYVMGYLNEGYDKLMQAYRDEHPQAKGAYPPLTADYEEPALPLWLHRSLADYATWMIYRNGNPQKQNRGYPFRSAFEETLVKVKAEGGENGRPRNFFNIPD